LFLLRKKACLKKTNGLKQFLKISISTPFAGGKTVSIYFMYGFKILNKSSMKKNIILLCFMFLFKNIEAQKFNQTPTINAAKNLISSLSAEQKTKGVLAFNDPDRLE
jgi:hypothetical protein